MCHLYGRARIERPQTITRCTVRLHTSTNRLRLIRHKVDVPPVAIVGFVDEVRPPVDPRLLTGKLGTGQGVPVDRTGTTCVGCLIRRDDIVVVFGHLATRAGDDEVGAAVLYPYTEISGAGEELVGLTNVGVGDWLGYCSSRDEGPYREGGYESSGEVEMEAHIDLVFVSKGCSGALGKFQGQRARKSVSTQIAHATIASHGLKTLQMCAATKKGIRGAIRTQLSSISYLDRSDNFVDDTQSARYRRKELGGMNGEVC
ncbi:hypothetical protein V499_02628 [Pseudogymnoascus sp. VKM F-103]|nr:hypothetical protein V499_02628 [Pseudogymnoascus sp. VKM F-103]